MNQVQLLGRLARDAEVSYTATGKAVGSFTIAVATPYFDTRTNEKREVTDFVNCVAWGSMGEYVGGFRKGEQVFCTGRIQTRSYTGKDGVKRYVTEVVTDFVVGKANQGTSNFDSMAAKEQVNEEIPF